MDALFIFDNGIYEDAEVYYSGKHKEAQYGLMPQDLDFVNLY